MLITAMMNWAYTAQASAGFPPHLHRRTPFSFCVGPYLVEKEECWKRKIPVQRNWKAVGMTAELGQQALSPGSSVSQAAFAA